MADTKTRKRSNLLISIAWSALCAMGVSSPALAITTQSDIDPEDLVDVDNTFSNVGGLVIFTQTSPTTAGAFVCSGTLVNPRTVFTATHCVANDFGGSELYTEGGFFGVGVTFDPQFGIPGAINWINTGAGMNDVTDVIMPPDQHLPGVFSFPDMDFTILALGTPEGDIPTAPIMLSPITHQFLATMAGFGTTGSGGEFDPLFLDFRRRSAVNLVQYLGNFDDIVEDAGFGPGQGGSTQMLYFVDYDPTDRVDFFDPHFIDWDPLPGDALNHPDPTRTEGATGGGDSGGPLFTRIEGQNFIVGTLSGGLTFYNDEDGFGLFNYYGEHSYWNPLFKYADFIVANNPYKYVGARPGNGDWMDPRHWVQLLDPNYYILDRNGSPERGIPRRAPDDEDVKFGNQRDIFDVDPAYDGLPPSYRDAPVAEGSESGSVIEVRTGRAELSVDADRGPVPETAAAASSSPASGGGSGHPGPLQGPGSRNFVPNNTDGTPGVAFENPAQYFDVTLDRYGTTWLRDAVEIDHLTFDEYNAALDIRNSGALTVNLETEIIMGRLNVDGTLATRSLVNLFGVLSGDGVVSAANGVHNLAGIVSPDGFGIGTLSIDGDFSQSGFGSMFYQIGRHSNDLLDVSGQADVAGSLIVDSDRRLRFGDRFTVIQAGSVVGNFDRTFGSGTILFGDTVADETTIDLVIKAHKFGHFFGHGHSLWSFGNALDQLRDGHYGSLVGVFDLVDNIQLGALEFVLPSLTPMGAFQEVSLAVNYSQGFIRDLGARSDELRAGVRGVSERSLLNGYRILQSGADESGLRNDEARPLDMGDRFGLFVSGRGNLADVGGEAYEGGRYNPASLSASSMADLTVGVDYRVSDHFALGVATTISRFLTRSDQLTPLDHTGYGAMLYATAWDGAWSLDSYVGMARQDYEMSRLVTPGMAPLAADAAPGAVQTLAGLRAGWTANPIEGLAVGPRLSVNYSRIDLDAYKEMGAGAFDLLVDGRAIDSLQVETAMEVSYQPLRENGERSPFAMFGRAGLVNEVGDGADMVQARFAAAPDAPFAIARSLDRQWFSAATGFSYRFDERTSLSLEASSDIGRDDFATTSVQLGFSRAF